MVEQDNLKMHHNIYIYYILIIKIKQDNYKEININISSNGINSKSGFWPVWKMWL